MDQIKVLFMDEAVFLDQAQIKELEKLLGSRDAESVIAKAMEEVALRLTKSESCFQAENWKELRKTVKSIAAIGEQIGMRSLKKVSTNAVDALDGGNSAAIAATYSRLVRVGDRSLSEFWDLQDISG